MKRTKTPTPYIQNNITIAEAEGKGRGVFATNKISKDDLIEIAPLVTIPEKEWSFVSATILTDYFFETEEEHAAIALGYASLYNHDFECNADYVVGEDRIIITATRDIKPGEEITIDYGWEAFHFFEKKIISQNKLEQMLEEELSEEDT